MLDSRESYTPTPAVSQAILAYNRDRTAGLADGIVITPSHNPPEFGGFKYDPPTGGPADTHITAWIEERANAIIAGDLREVARQPFERARRAATNHPFDYREAYVEALGSVIDMDVLRGSPLAIGVDPLGGASVDYWEPIAERYGLRLEVVNREVDPTFRFMTVDWDGAIRMDPSSPYAMTRLIGLRERFDLAFANDPDADRHGIVSRVAGLLNPNHYLAVAIDYLYRHRPGMARRRRRGQDHRQQQHDRSRGEPSSAADSSKFRSGSSGSWTVSSTARWDSAARRARARRSSAATAVCGRPTRTGSSLASWPWR